MSKTTLLKSIHETLTYAHTRLSKDQQQWAPVSNSLDILKEISANIDDVVKLTARYNSGHLNVGLLAAKGLDGSGIPNIQAYSDLLHHVSANLMHYLNINPWGP